MSPENIADFEKAAVSVGDTTTSGFADALAAYQVVSGAFAESLRNFGAFDAMLPVMRRVPLHARVGMSTTGFTATTVAQHHPKPITKLSMTATTLDEKKAVAICVLTEELLRFSMAAITDFQAEMQNALAVETDETFVEILTSGATSFGSSGVTAEHVRNDLRAALGSITTGARSRLYLLMPSALAKVLAVLYDETGGSAFPTMTVNGGDIAGITVIVSDGVPANTIILADATQIAAASETITLTSSNETTLQMDTTPDSPPTASTAYVNLWQMNWRALRAERWFGAAKLSTTGVCVITSVNWTGEAMLDERLKLLDAEMAHFAGLSAPTLVISTEQWFRAEIRKALEPLIGRIVRIETKPASAPTATTFKPPQEFISAIGQTLHDEIKPLRERLEVLERKIDDLEMKQAQFRYCGVWSADAVYFEGNFVTHHGSLWHAHRQTTQQPGDGSDFTLCVKRGKDGKDADNVRRLPTPARTYGS
jgi:hypothetical protein